MQLVILGTGNVATVLGKAFHAKGHSVNAVWGRNAAAAKELAASLHATAYDSIAALPKYADAYMIAVADPAIAAIATQLRVDNQLVFHCGGAVKREVLADCSNHYGVLWPIHMIRKGQNLPDAFPVVLDASNTIALQQLESLAVSLSQTLLYADDAKRSRMHMLTATAVNFTNHLLHLVWQHAAAHDIDPIFLLGILENMLKGLQQRVPSAQQAGPAYRGDLNKLQEQLAVLKDDPALQEVYAFMSQQILNTYHPGKAL
jgi:predicted short-subunit dehydrogenase-like oxidoreductase (DUF2520 family)